MAIVGESGSGKTTLGLALMGLLPRNSVFASRGVTIDESTIDLSSSKQLRSVRGGAFQNVAKLGIFRPDALEVRVVENQ